MQRVHDEERRQYESRNENERKKMVNQADNDKSEHQQRMEQERTNLERVIDGLKAQNAKALSDKENLQKEVVHAQQESEELTKDREKYANNAE